MQYGVGKRLLSFCPQVSEKGPYFRELALNERHFEVYSGTPISGFKAVRNLQPHIQNRESFVRNFRRCSFYC